MTSEEHQTLLEIAESLRDLFDRQAAANRSLHTLYLALKTQLPDLEAAYSKAQTDALFATEESLTLEKSAQIVRAIIERLNR